MSRVADLGTDADEIVVLTTDELAPSVAEAVPTATVRTVSEGTLPDVLAELGERADVLDLVSVGFVGHARAVRSVLEGPGTGAAALTGPGPDGPGAAVTVRQGHLVRVDEDVADTDTRLLGVLRLPGELARYIPSFGAGATEPSDSLAGVVHRLLLAGADVRAVPVRGFVAERVVRTQDLAQVLVRVEDVDEDTAAMHAAVKAHDGWFTTFFVSPYSRHVARWCGHLGITPNQVTVASMVVGTAAAAAFATGTVGGRVLGAVLLQAAFLLDCVDGQLARYALRFSAFGAWLDGILDRGKEYLVYAGLALGAVRAGDDGTVWLLAALALALQTLRHHLDLAYNAQQEAEEAERRRRGPAPPDEAAGRQPRLIRTAHGLNRIPAVKWGKQILTLPIGERFLLISLVAALLGPVETFVALLVWGAVAGSYTATGRLLRSRAA